VPQQEERIIEGPLSPDYVVEKSRRILNLSDMVYSTMQMKFLDIYLSRIDPRDENSRTVRFTLDELADLFGVERIRYERIGTLLGESQDLKETHKDLPLELENIKFTYEIDDEEKRGFVRAPLFVRSAMFRRKDDNSIIIEMTCHEDAKRLFFNLQGVGYIRYRLKNVIPMSGKYSMLLYLYLLDKFNFGNVIVEQTVDYLKHKVFKMDEQSEGIYSEYKYFSQRVLKYSVAEINKHTNLQVAFTPIRSGKKVASIRFDLTGSRKELTRREQYLLPYEKEYLYDDEVVGEEYIAEWRKALQPFCLSDGEIRDLYLFAKHKELNLYADREDPQKTAERVRTLIGGTFSGIAARAKNKNPKGRHFDYLRAILEKIYEREG